MRMKLTIFIKNKTMSRTKEELIVFQNQSSLVQRYFNDCGICPSLLTIALATDVMVDFALNGPTKAVLERFEKMEKYIQVEKEKQDGKSL
jgi:hypothetical protein